MGKIVIGQAGGPTAVINTSLVGFIENISGKSPIYGVLNGYEGLVNENYIKLEGPSLNWAKSNKYMPAACLGSGRYPFAEEQITIAVDNLIKNNITTLVFIGGNGTMAALQDISEASSVKGYPLQVIGIPKTVDNDLGLTDHAPGFGSAAKFVAYSARDISLDLRAMSNFEKVRIIETMGRNAGWLALAAGALQKDASEGPHKIYIPEQKFFVNDFLRDIKDVVKEYGTAAVVVSEGLKIDDGDPIHTSIINERTVLGGISQRLQTLVETNLGFVCRAENLGMNQRCFSLAVSNQDRLEAYEVGKKAAELVKDGKTGVMVGIKRTAGNEYNFTLEGYELVKVRDAGERLLPAGFINNPEVYYEWLSPLI